MGPPANLPPPPSSSLHGAPDQTWHFHCPCRWPTLVLGLLPSRAEILALLRDWAAVASAQNVHELLQHTLELSSLCGIPISEVVSAPQFMIAPPTVAAPVAAPSSTMRPFPEPPSLSPYDPPPPASVTPPIRSPTQPPPSHCPEAVTARLTRRCFPSLARRIERGPDGLEVLHANQCMEQMVARQAERMREQAEAGPPPVPPGLHPDDEGVLPLAIERLRCGLDAADGAELPSSTSLVRIDSSLANCSTFSAGQRWKPVHVTTSLMLVEGQRWLFQEFEPIASRELVVVEQGDGAACSAESGPLELTCSEQAARAADGSSTKQFTEAKLLAAAGLAAAPPAAAPPANVFPELGLGLGPSPSTSALTDSSALTSPSDNDCEESPLEFIDVRELDSLLCQAEKKKDGLEPGVGQLVGCGSG